MKRRKIIISGGHLTPALAVAEILPRLNWEILFVGRKYSLEGENIPSVESKVVPQKGIRFISIDAGRIQRRFSWQTIPSLLKIPLGFLQSFFWVLKFKPDVFLSFGGYVAAPLSLASWLDGIPIITHIQSVKPGLADRFISIFAKKICYSWEETKAYLNPRKRVFTGNPLRLELLESLRHSRRKFLPKTITSLVIYITGGSQGSTWINQVIKKSFPQLKKYFLIHQCGQRDYLLMKEFREKLTEEEKNHYLLKDWFSVQEVGEILKTADLIIGRSGANTVLEALAFAKPAIFIPLPWAGGNEQAANAQKLAKLGLAKILPQEKFNPETLVNSVEEVFSQLKNLKKKASKVKKFFQPQAAKLIVEEIEKAISF